jgi:hypothetical protein
LLQDSSIRTKILNSTSYELKLLLRGILIPAFLISFFTYIIISIIDVERSGYYNSIPSSVILSLGTLIVLKLLFYTKLEKIEINRFRLIFLSLICWLIGELIYVYQQVFLGIAVPYPSIADIFYLSATVFLSFHLFNIIRLKKIILKNKYLFLLGFLSSAFPIYFLIDTIYHYEEYYPDSLLEFVVNASYYISDAVVVFPCLPIILYSSKNDPFIFHWLLITLSVFILVTADLGYTFVASINDELLQNIEWLWSFIFSIGYILLSVSILWFNKLKEILEYKKFFEGLKKEQNNILDDDNSLNKILFKFDDSTSFLRTITNMTTKANTNIDILVAQYIIKKNEIIKFLNILTEMTKKNKILNIRILLPSYTLYDMDIFPNINSQFLIKYFDRQLSSNTITLILDSENIYLLGKSENTNENNQYFIQSINNESERLVYITLFERMWLLEKSVAF